MLSVLEGWRVGGLEGFRMMMKRFWTTYGRLWDWSRLPPTAQFRAVVVDSASASASQILVGSFSSHEFIDLVSCLLSAFWFSFHCHRTRFKSKRKSSQGITSIFPSLQLHLLQLPDPTTHFPLRAITPTPLPPPPGANHTFLNPLPPRTENSEVN